MPRLVGMASLKMYGCVWLDDQCLDALAGHCHVLQTLDISGCQLITDTGVSALARGCSNLKFVDLTFCSRTTYSSVLNLHDICGSDIVVGPTCIQQS